MRGGEPFMEDLHDSVSDWYGDCKYQVHQRVRVARDRNGFSLD